MSHHYSGPEWGFPRGDALTSRWHISMVAADADPHRLAAMMIDHGDYGEAEHLLSECLNDSETTVQLLAVDTRTRAGKLDAAYELLLAINRDHTLPHLRYSFAVACAHLGLSRNDPELKSLAATKLLELRFAGTRAARAVSDLLQELDNHDIQRSEHLIDRARRLIGLGPALHGSLR
jgi:hypothetical protein